MNAFNDHHKIIEKIKNREPLHLYHGSKGGIDGEIAPMSRVRCDFGKGFYMGTDMDQAKGIVAGDDSPFYYRLKLDLPRIPKAKIAFLNDRDWLYAIMAFRKTVPEFSETSAAKAAIQKVNETDIVIGMIADDKMREAMTAFMDNALTDEGLFYCLSKVDYGLQIVLKTSYACSAVDILEEHYLKGRELDDAMDYAEHKRAECRDIVKYAKKEFTKRGKRIYDLLDSLDDYDVDKMIEDLDYGDL